MPFPYIYTFYSYKGGVGRSMALMNVAYALAGKGRHVLMVDMDLEAPGISSFLERNGELDLAQSPEGDVFSLLECAISLISSGTPTEKTVAALPSLATFVRSIPEAKLKGLEPKYGALGHLDVLPVRMDGTYTQRLADLGLKDLSHGQIRELSDLLHAWFKSYRFSHRLFGLEDFEPPVQSPYDYILVDSRTGITEVGGLCVGPLADRLVVLTGLNDQNVHGTRTFLEEVGIHTTPRSEGDNPWDEADPVSRPKTGHNSLGPKPTIVVVSPAPLGEVELKGKRLKSVESSLGIAPLSLSYHPLMALYETNFVRDCPGEPLAADYRNLTSRVMRQIRDDASSLASEIQSMAITDENIATAMNHALRLAADRSELGEIILKQLDDDTRRMDRTPDPETRRVRAFLSQDPDDASIALSGWGTALTAQAGTKQGEEADRLFAAAYEKYERALAIKPDLHEALNNWASALDDQAKTKQGEEADRLFAASYDKYERALAIKPDKHEALNNWGNALVAQARTKQGEEADGLFAAAYEALLQAEQAAPNSAAYNLACLEALQSRTVEAIQWLERARAASCLPSIEHMANDSDLDAIRSTPEFKHFLASLEAKPAAAARRV